MPQRRLGKENTLVNFAFQAHPHHIAYCSTSMVEVVVDPIDTETFSVT
ncbi:MAG: hypothetical protein ACE37N_09215 [Pseudohongiellaceae bacterium]